MASRAVRLHFCCGGADRFLHDWSIVSIWADENWTLGQGGGPVDGFCVWVPSLVDVWRSKSANLCTILGVFAIHKDIATPSAKTTEMSQFETIRTTTA